MCGRSEPTLWRVELTESYDTVIPAAILARYDFREVRKAAAVLRSTNEQAFDELMAVLGGFSIEAEDITEPGGNKSRIAEKLDEAFRKLGWREAQHTMSITSILKLMPYRAAGERKPREVKTEVLGEGYKVDNVKARVFLDVEWHAKDGNLDRDVGAYRALYDAAIIDVGVIITRDLDTIRDLADRLGRPGAFSGTTTTNMTKLVPRLKRGDGGGCPILAIAITDRCYAP